MKWRMCATYFCDASLCVHWMLGALSVSSPLLYIEWRKPFRVINVKTYGETSTCMGSSLTEHYNIICMWKCNSNCMHCVYTSIVMHNIQHCIYIQWTWNRMCIYSIIQGCFSTVHATTASPWPLNSDQRGKWQVFVLYSSSLYYLYSWM